MNKIMKLNEMAKIRQKIKAENKKLVFTNGCFDILHRGHVQYLQEAKSMGDYLILGLNSDSSVRRLKGKTRPINSEEDRAIVLAALESIDFVVIFEEDTPYNLIKNIVPDILVKGGDWSVDQIVGSDIVMKNGGEVKSLKFVQGRSTTNVIEKVLSQTE